MASNHAKIWKALKSHLELYPDLPFVAYGGEPFTPPSTNGVTEPYFIVDDVRFDGERKYQGTPSRIWHTGVLSISIMIPLHWDDLQSSEYAGAIADYFTQDDAMTFEDVTVKVSRTPTISGAGFRDGDMFRIPVLVPWEGFV